MNIEYSTVEKGDVFPRAVDIYRYNCNEAELGGPKRTASAKLATDVSDNTILMDLYSQREPAVDVDMCRVK